MHWPIPLSETFLKKIHQHHQTALTNGPQAAAYLMNDGAGKVALLHLLSGSGAICSNVYIGLGLQTMLDHPGQVLLLPWNSTPGWIYLCLD